MRSLLILSLLLTAAPAGAQDVASLPGQPGGDPGPDTQAANDALKKGRYEDAIASSRSALQRSERHVPAMMAMAKAYYHLKKYELSGSIIELIRQLEPNNAEAFHLLGFIALARGDNGGATANFKRTTELKPDYGNAWNNLAAQYLLSKSYDPAVEAAERAVQLMPNFDKAHLNLGSAYRGKGRVADAERELKRALELNPGYAEAYFNLGILYLDAPQVGTLDLITKENQAMNYLAKYKSLAGYRLPKDDPSDLYVEEARKAIEREQKRLERVKKQKERDAAKKPDAAPAAPPAAPAGGGN